MIQSALGSSSKNSNLAHHQQRGIVTSIFPQHFMRFVPNNILRFCFKIKFNIFLISKLMDTFLELANSGVKFKIRFAERRLALNYAEEAGQWTPPGTRGWNKTSPENQNILPTHISPD